MLMKTITLKADDELDETVSRLARQRNKTRSAVIREAIISYEEHLRKSALKEEIRKASMAVRKDTLKTMKELGDANADGL